MVFYMNEDNQVKTLVKNLDVAKSFFPRFKGLLGRKELGNKEGLLIYPCNQIHMLFMKFPIDVVYLNKDFKIIGITRNIQPWKIDKPVKGAYYALELSANTTEELTIGINLYHC